MQARKFCRLVTLWTTLTLGSGALSQTGSSTLPNRKGYFISIDGMRPDYLETLTNEGKLNAPRGLGWLLRHSARSRQALPVEISLTAPSHASTITCSRPGTHGIIANNFLSGDQVVSGFSADIHSETMWEAARSEGRKVLGLAYAGADGRTAQRQVDSGIAYPDGRFVGPSQTLSLTFVDLPQAQGWNFAALPRFKHDSSDLRETTAKVLVNPATHEERSFQILLARAQNQPITVLISASKNPSPATSVILKESIDQNESGSLFWVETNDASPLNGFKRRLYGVVLDRTQDKISLFLSKTTYNNAHPASFRQQLDAANLVWPDEGLKGDKTPQGPARSVATYNIHGRFLVDVAQFAQAKSSYDVVLLYQPVIDSLGHSYEAMLPQPFTSRNLDRMTQGYVRAYQAVDQNISRLLQGLTAQDVVALMGDHGMDPAKKIINLAALIPQDAAKIRVVTSGALALVYRGENSSEEIADSVGASLDAKLRTLSSDGQGTYGKAHRRSTELTSRKSWQFGEAIWAFTAGANYFYKFDPIATQIFSEATALGMHGHDPELPTMATAFLLRAPGVKPQIIGKMSLIDAVPTFSRLMGFRAPRDCEGTALKVLD